MIKAFVEKWEAGKDGLRKHFESAHPENYKAIVKAVIDCIADEHEYDLPDPSRIHEIDDGDYQGTLVYVIGGGGYQPSSYWYVKVSYGSCSGCDTLQAIKDYSSEQPTERQVAGYMTLALHILQGLKPMQAEDD
jgi:hypothetical protein